MDVDSGPKPKEDDLSAYKLDEYDDDAKTAGTRSSRSLFCILISDNSRCWAVQ